MSSSTSHARNRLGSAVGWVRPDGKPFVKTVDDLLAGRIYYPARLDEKGNDLRGALIATGTDAGGMRAFNCMDFAGGPTDTMTIGYADSAGVSWTGLSEFACSNPMHITCFGADRDTPLEIKPTTGKRAFISKKVHITSAANADMTCSTEAGTGSFHALVATTTAAANASLAGGPWVRRDGVVFTRDLTSIEAPLDIGSDDKRIHEAVAVGAAALDQLASASDNCADWTGGTSFDGGGSDRSAVAEALQDPLISISCLATYRLYCLER
jgi:hypothetical protein